MFDWHKNGSEWNCVQWMQPAKAAAVQFNWTASGEFQKTKKKFLSSNKEAQPSLEKHSLWMLLIQIQKDAHIGSSAVGGKMSAQV